MYDQGKVRISSLHNFCPLPMEVQGASPDCYEFTSHRPFDQRRAVKLTLQTIDFAHRLGAGLVVLHLGRVAMTPVTRKLGKLAKEGKFLDREFVRLKIAAVKEREARAPVFLARVKECLKPIVEHAASKNVNLGIESRFGYEEVPSERELPGLLEELNAAARRLLARFRARSGEEQPAFRRSLRVAAFDPAPAFRLPFARHGMARDGPPGAVRRGDRVRPADPAAAAELPVRVGTQSAHEGGGHPGGAGKVAGEVWCLTALRPRHPSCFFTESSLFDLLSRGYLARFAPVRMKKALITTLQVAVMVFAFYWVFRKPETRAQMLATLQHGDYRWIVAAVLMAGLAPVCAVVRWWSLLRVQKNRHDALARHAALHDRHVLQPLPALGPPAATR